MGDWSLPTLSSTYSNFLTELDNRLDDLALGNDPASRTLTNTVTNTICWSSASNKWQKYNGSAWVDLTTTYAIRVSSADAWSTGRTITLSGDVTGTSGTWSGNSNLSFATTLSTTGVTAGSYGSATAVPVLTIDNKGRITAAGTSSIGTMGAQSATQFTIGSNTLTCSIDLSASASTLKIPQSTTQAPTVEGSIGWDTDNDLLVVGDGTYTKTMVDTNSTQSLTNKTVSTSCTWNGNTISLTYGGTGATDAATARTNLGLGSIATQGSGSISITGGAISGTAITLVNSTTAAPTVEGVIEWDTDDDLLKIGTGSGTKILVNTDNTQTLTNKTFTTPVLSGTASGTVAGRLGYLSGVLSFGDGTNQRTVVTLDGTQTLSGKTLTTPVLSSTASGIVAGSLGYSTGVLSFGDGTNQRTVVTLDGTQTLSNKTFSSPVLGTPTSGTLTNCTGLPTAGLVDNSVTDAKLRTSTGLSVIGRGGGGAGNVADIAASSNSGAVLRESGSTIGFGTLSTLGIADAAVTYAKIQNISATDKILGRYSAGTGSVEEITCTSFARSLLDDTDAATARTTLGAAADFSTQTIWIPAGAITARTTGGAAVGSAELSTNKIMVKTLDFDAATVEYAQFSVAMPKGWNESTVTAEFIWSHAATTTNFGVVWGLQGLAVSDDDALDAAFGTAQTVTDTGGTTDDLYKSAATPAITIGGTPAEGDTVIFQVYRNATNGSDTMTIDARLHGVKLFYTTASLNDA